MPEPLQILLVLEVDGHIDVNRVVAHLGGAPVPARQVLRLSDFGFHRPQGFTPRDQLDWAALASGLYALTTELRSRIDAARPSGPVEVIVVGLAPLAVFYAVGTHLDLRTEAVTVVNERRNEPGTWDVLRLTTSDTSSPSFFAGLPPSMRDVSESTGRAVVFVSTQHSSEQVPREALRAAVRGSGGEVGGIVPLVTGEPRSLDGATVGGCFRQLVDAFRDVASAYPHRAGLFIAVAGPASLALAAGVATNPHQHEAPATTIQVGEHVAGRYISALTLPLSLGTTPTIPSDPADVLARETVFRSFRAGFDRLREHIELQDVAIPQGLDPRSESLDPLRAEILNTLSGLSIGNGPEGDAFELQVLQGRLKVGHGLLHALVGVTLPALESLGQLLTLHELVHDHQGISSNNYRGIGRSGVVLEEADFWADAFALLTAGTHFVRQHGPAGERGVAQAMVALIDAHIAAMRAFDRMELGGRPGEMPERRVRRYLIWYLQRARAATMRRSTDLRPLFCARLAVELAPLRGRLDPRGDKIAVEPTAETVFTFALGGLVRRVAALPQNFDPAALLREVVSGADVAVQARMDFVVSEHRDVLVPWAARNG